MTHVYGSIVYNNRLKAFHSDLLFCYKYNTVPEEIFLYIILLMKWHPHQQYVSHIHYQQQCRKNFNWEESLTITKHQAMKTCWMQGQPSQILNSVGDFSKLKCFPSV